jgi:hypothetical protein
VHLYFYCAWYLVAKFFRKPYHVWIDCATGAVNPMLISDNTIQGPIIDGNSGPGTNGMYADIFSLLSAIPNKTINIPHIHAVRIFISFKEQLYLYFFGAGGGYSAPSLSNATDPNQGIRYELIELTYGDNGLWTNTTRVDHYQYPMGLEVWGEGGFYKKVGEILTHDQIIDTWKNRVPSQFLACLDNELEIIHAPSKTAAFAEDGAYFSYFDSYVDAVWARYTNEDLTLSIGEAGLYKGRVYGEEFRFTNQANGVVGIIRAKPNTQEIFEAKGVLATDEPSTPDIYADQNVQKHFSAAFNRGAIDANAPAGQTIEWSNEAEFFTHEPYNQYVKFWHSRDISFEGETYAFAYDDVFDYSSTIQSGAPTKVKVTIGGFAGQTPVGLPIPGTIQAEDFSAMSGIQTENTSDIGGGINVGWIDAGDWLDYNVNVSAAGTYTFNMRLAADGTAQKTVQVQAATTGSVTFTATGGWQNWTTESGTVNLKAGEQTIRIYAVSTGFNVNWIEFTTNENPVLTTINLTPQNAIINTGSTQQFTAVGKDQFGNTIAFTPVWTGTNATGLFTESTSGTYNVGVASGSVSASTNITVNTVSESCTKYEAEEWADMSGVQTEGTADVDGGLNVGWINTNDWIDIDVFVSTPGDYTLNLRGATPNGPDVCLVQVDGVVAGQIDIANTGGWQTWETFETTINISSAGNHVLRFLALTDGFNMNWIELCGDGGESTACNVEAATGDFSVEISADGTNPSLTFVPTVNGTGSALCLLFYGTSASGPYPANSVTPNVPFQINANAGETVYFYYTYNLASGGENNNSANKNSFVVGSCESTLKSASIATTVHENLGEVKMYPNPVKDNLMVDLGDKNSYKNLQLIDYSGKVIYTQSIENGVSKLPISMKAYENGIYILMLSSNNAVKTFKVLKN